MHVSTWSSISGGGMMPVIAASAHEPYLLTFHSWYGSLPKELPESSESLLSDI